MNTRLCLLTLGLLLVPVPVLSGQIEDRPVHFAIEGAELDFSPPRLRYCGLPVVRTAINVSWDVTGLGINEVELYLNGRDGTLFARGKATGEAETGDWVRNGTRFVLYSPQLDEVVAERSFRLIPCNTDEFPDEYPHDPE